MNENALFKEIIQLLRNEGWKEQVCGMVGFSGSTGSNFYKNGKLLSLSMTEERHMTYPDPEELEEMFGRCRKKANPKEIIFDDDENYFGHCRVPEHENYYLNIGRTHWMVCDKCRIKWFMGENLFSSWRSQDKETWERNAKLIADFKEIDF